jgi:hypothetical protein
MAIASYITEAKGFRHPRKHISTGMYHGWEYHREFDVDMDQVANALAGDLLLGKVLPQEWGGPATTDIGTARLEECSVEESKTGSQVRILTEWLEIELTGTTFTSPSVLRETTKSRKITREVHEDIMTMIGFCSTVTDVGIPVYGKTIAAAQGAAITDYVARTINVIPEYLHNRVLVHVEFVAHKAMSAYGP